MDGVLDEISPYRRSRENERPLHVRTPSSGSQFTQCSRPDRSRFKKAHTLESLPIIESNAEDRPHDKDLDKLLAQLEDANDEEVPVKDEVIAAGAPRSVPDDLLHTDLNTGLDSAEASKRRRTFGLNQMKEEKKSHIKQFLLFFVGPIQFVMEVSRAPDFDGVADASLLHYQAACILAALLKDWIDLGVIVCLLLLNAVVGFAQDFQAGNIVKVGHPWKGWIPLFLVFLLTQVNTGIAERSYTSLSRTKEWELGWDAG